MKNIAATAELVRGLAKSLCLCGLLTCISLPLACMSPSPRTLFPIKNTPEERLIRTIRPGFTMLLIQMLTVPEEENKILERLWLYVNEAALDGTSAEIWHKNGVRIGLADEIFINEARTILKDLKDKKISNTLIQKPSGHAFRISAAYPAPLKEIPVFSGDDSFRVAPALFQLTLTPGPVEKYMLPLRVTAAVLRNPDEPRGLQLESLAGDVRCRWLQPIIIGRFGDSPQNLGGVFAVTEVSGSRFEILMIVYPVFRPR